MLHVYKHKKIKNHSTALLVIYEWLYLAKKQKEIQYFIAFLTLPLEHSEFRTDSSSIQPPRQKQCCINFWIQVFSVPSSQVYKIKELPMQSAFANTCEKIVFSKKLPESACCPVTGFHLCSKLVCEISCIVDIPQASISGIIASENIQ